MQSSLPRPRRVVLALLTVLASGGALGGIAAAGASEGAASCRIRAARAGDAIALTGLAESDRTVSGTYSLRVSGGSGSGGTDIRQGGAFRSVPGRPATLGTVTVNASGATYDVDLRLDLDGETVACSKRITGGRV